MDKALCGHLHRHAACPDQILSLSPTPSPLPTLSSPLFLIIPLSFVFRVGKNIEPSSCALALSIFLIVAESHSLCLMTLRAHTHTLHFLYPFICGWALGWSCLSAIGNFACSQSQTSRRQWFCHEDIGKETWGPHSAALTPGHLRASLALGGIQPGGCRG